MHAATPPLATLRPKPHRGGGGRHDLYSFAHEATAMLALGLVLNALDIDLLGRLILHTVGNLRGDTVLWI